MTFATNKYSLNRLIIEILLRIFLIFSLLILFLVRPAMSETKEKLLLAAAQRGDTQSITSLIKEGVSLDARDERGQTALLIATRINKIVAARILIQAGADVNAKDAIQDSPYLYAGARGHLEILKMTLVNGADLGSTNRFGGTALIPAAERGHVETAETLIKAGVDVNHINNLGWTALLEAIILGDGGPRHLSIVKLLLAGGARTDITDKDGVTPLQHAQQRGYDEIAAALISAR